MLVVLPLKVGGTIYVINRRDISIIARFVCGVKFLGHNQYIHKTGVTVYTYGMTEPVPTYDIKPGQPRLGTKPPKTVRFKMSLLESQKDHIEREAKELKMSAAAYIRHLIDNDMS